MSLKKAREKSGLSQEKLALKVGVGRSTITMIETGVNQLTVPLAKKIAEVLDIDWTELFED